MANRAFDRKGTVRVIRTGADTGSGTSITDVGTIAVKGGTNLNSSVDGTNITVNMDTAVTGLTDIDMTPGDKTILDTIGGYTVTMGVSGTTFSIPGSLSVAGTLTSTGTSTLPTLLSLTNLTVTGYADIEGYAAIGNGSSVDANYGLIIDYDRTFTADNGAQLKVAGTMNGRNHATPANNTFYGVYIQPESMIVNATTDLVASMYIGDPTLTSAGSLTTTAATLYLGAAPTEAVTNYSLYSTSGAVQFDACDTFNIFSTTNGKPILHLKNTAAGADGPEIILEADNGASPADEDFLGTITFNGDDSGAATTTFANIKCKASDVTNTAECGEIDFQVMANGTMRNLFSIGGQDVAGAAPLEVVVNEESVACNFRVESNGHTDMIFVDGTNDRLGIQCTPASGFGLDVEPIARYQNYIAMKVISAPSVVSGHALLYAKTDTNSEMFVKDDANNETKISPHNKDNEWEFFSRNLNSGKVVKIQMQKLMKRLNDLFGEPEWFEEFTDEP